MDQDKQRRIQDVMVCSLLCVAKCVPTPYNLFTAMKLGSESGLLAAKNRDGSGQAEKDTGRHGVFTVVCCKMCAHPLQSLYSYQTSFSKKQRWMDKQRRIQDVMVCSLLCVAKCVLASSQNNDNGIKSFGRL